MPTPPCPRRAQAAAIDALLAGRDVMLATPTASGKSLAYNVPCLHALATDAAARAIFIFPTKALAQDQLRALRALCNAGATALFGTLVATYDGDTPQADRPALRRDARVLLTNPDMLHQAGRVRVTIRVRPTCCTRPGCPTPTPNLALTLALARTRTRTLP